MRLDMQSLVLKDCIMQLSCAAPKQLFTPMKYWSWLALGSPGCLFVRRHHTLNNLKITLGGWSTPHIMNCQPKDDVRYYQVLSVPTVLSALQNFSAGDPYKNTLAGCQIPHIIYCDVQGAVVLWPVPVLSVPVLLLPVPVLFVPLRLPQL